MYYEEIFRKFQEKKIRYVVVGGLALNLHGIPRMTNDLDIIIDLEKGNIQSLFKGLKELGYIPRLPFGADDFISPSIRKSWLADKSMIVFSFWNPDSPYKELDIFIENPINFSELDRTKTNMSVEDMVIPVVSVENLKTLKKISARPQDLADLQELNKLKPDEE